MASGNAAGQGTIGSWPHNKRLQQTIAAVTLCAGAQTAPSTLAAEPNVRHTMKYPNELPKRIAARIMGGELPSVVMRSTILQFPSIEHFGPLLKSAFGNTGLLYAFWHWPRLANSEERDTDFNISVIESLLDEGVTVPWDLEYCEAERVRIAPVLAAERQAKRQAEREAVSFENLAARIKEFEGEPACIQALWDGDSRGWHVWLSVFMNSNGSIKEESLGIVRFGLEYATEVGHQLADHFGAEFYFPPGIESDVDPIGWGEKQAEAKTNPGRRS